MEAVDNNYFATAAQTHLLKAILQNDQEEVTESLSLWKKEQDLNDIDAGSLRLIPMLGRRMADLKLDDANLPFYNGVYRKSWMKNKLLFHQLAKVSDILNAAGIPFLVLKGAALTALYYNDNGLRPMDDLDIIVPEDQAQRAIKLFEQNGWHSKQRVHPSKTEKYFHLYKHLVHSVDYVNQEGFCLDIHWKAAEIATSPAPNRGVWDSFQLFTVNGTEFQTASAEFHLYHTIVHGIQANKIAPIRWIIDVSVILKAEGDKFNWEKFIEIVRVNNAAFFIGKGIEYLVTFPGALIPPSLQKKIADFPVNPSDEREFKVMRNSDQRFSYYYYYWLYYLKLRDSTPDWSALPFFSGYITYVRIKTNMKPVFRLSYLAAKLLLTGKK